ncbi:MAG: hypothetical protein JWN95_3586 [Frankiales bacterium]|nr:hypothetical protein [Frankiales bacterium]
MVLVAVALLASIPVVLQHRPAADAEIPAADLLARIQRSASVPYSGYAESSGTLDLPSVSQFGSVSDLLSSRTQLRVFVRGSDDWRVDTVTPVGETDLHATAAGVWSWDYESSTSTFTVGGDTEPARLLRADDLLPANLARRLLSQALPTEVSRIGAERIAGHDAVGLRLRPAEPQSTIDRVDVWALAASGLPVRVDVYAKGASIAVLTTSMLDLSTSRPSASDTAFSPPVANRIRSQSQPDIVSLVDRLGRVRPPSELAGLPRNAQSIGSVGAYGRGVTAMLAVPVPPRLSGTVRTQLAATVGSSGVADGDNIALALAGVNLLMLPRDGDGWAWLLIGTVTADALSTAAGQLPEAGGRG